MLLLVVWILLAVVVFVGLFATALGVRRRRRPGDDDPPAEAPAPAAPERWERPPEGTLDIAVLTFEGVVGAERAFAIAREDAPTDPWLQEVAFVEHHHRIRHRRARHLRRALSRRRGTPRQARPEDSVDVPEGNSALLVFAGTKDVDAMVRAFDGSGAQVSRHRVSASENAAAFEASVAQAPPGPRSAGACWSARRRSFTAATATDGRDVRGRHSSPSRRAAIATAPGCGRGAGRG